MSPARLGLILMLVALIFCFIETAYFGWNRRPCCTAEAVCDHLVGVVMFLGIFTRWDFGIRVRRSWKEPR